MASNDFVDINTTLSAQITNTMHFTGQTPLFQQVLDRPIAATLLVSANELGAAIISQKIGHRY